MGSSHGGGGAGVYRAGRSARQSGPLAATLAGTAKQVPHVFLFLKDEEEEEEEEEEVESYAIKDPSWSRMLTDERLTHICLRNLAVSGFKHT